MGMKLFFGVEVTAKQHGNAHILLYGVETDFLREYPAVYDMTLAEMGELVRARGGIAVPAHINRGSNGLLVNLGMMPLEPEFHLVEVSASLPVDERILNKRTVLHSSDAHQLGAISEATFDFPTDRFSFGGLWDTLKYAERK